MTTGCTPTRCAVLVGTCDDVTHLGLPDTKRQECDRVQNATLQNALANTRLTPQSYCHQRVPQGQTSKERKGRLLKTTCLWCGVFSQRKLAISIKRRHVESRGI
ncbi:hypothetical protein SKAU_G00118940 [Synaphobranchus kaupii]|uniref:Uncharacterized protein n=1 Tax=Synaphobranchus kaupii TaxID=118154 RepID=A0A9Q1J275_SYNKA|nr:hypothetical protein SKAU_G00118940 [Synaphobranchus kaupii]